MRERGRGGGVRLPTSFRPRTHGDKIKEIEIPSQEHVEETAPSSTIIAFCMLSRVLLTTGHRVARRRSRQESLLFISLENGGPEAWFRNLGSGPLFYGKRPEMLLCARALRAADRPLVCVAGASTSR